MSDAQPVLTTRRSPVQRRPGPPAKRYMSNSGGSPKVRGAIQLMIWGGEDGIPLKRQDAAKAMGIADVTLRNALGNPLVMKHYREQLDVLRTSARPRALHVIERLSEEAKSERTQLDAAKYLDGGDKASGITVNVGIQNLQPGYAVTVPQAFVEDARQMLKLSGSHANVLDLQADVPTDEPGTR